MVKEAALEEVTSTVVARETLAVDVAEIVIDWFKAQAKPWQLMTYAEQKTLVDGAEKMARDTIREAVNIIAADGRRVIRATVDKVAFVEKGVQATMMAPQSSEFRHDLADSRGQDVLIVVADAAELMGGEMQQPDAPKDGQPDLLGEDRPVFDNTRAAQG